MGPHRKTKIDKESSRKASQNNQIVNVQMKVGKVEKDIKILDAIREGKDKSKKSDEVSGLGATKL